jgi:hypothetical protein
MSHFTLSQYKTQICGFSLECLSILCVWMCWTFIQWPSIFSYFLEQCSYDLLYVFVQNVLNSCPCCQCLYWSCTCNSFTMLSVSTQQISSCGQWKDDDGTSECMSMTGSYCCHHFFPLQHQFTTFHHMCSQHMYRVMSPYAMWVGLEYCLKIHASKNILEPETQSTLIVLEFNGI